MAKSTLVDDGLILEINPEETPGQTKMRMRPSGVNAGTYTSTNLTVDIYGRIIAATSGSSGGSGGGDMETLIYDPAGIAQQFVGINSSQSLTNKIINGVTLTTSGLTTTFLNAAGAYTEPLNVVVELPASPNEDTVYFVMH